MLSKPSAVMLVAMAVAIGLPLKGKRCPLQIAVEPSYVPAPQPVPLTVGGRSV